MLVANYVPATTRSSTKGFTTIFSLATKLRGRTGEAAKRVGAGLDPYFQGDEEFALPPPPCCGGCRHLSIHSTNDPTLSSTSMTRSTRSF
jgi:hypothetical protein